MSAPESDLPWWKAKSSEQLGKEAKPNGLSGAAAGAKSYNSRSGGILGLLKQMGDNTAKNLASAQKEELEALISFQKLQAAKLAEIAAATEAEDTKEALAADQKFLIDMAKMCETVDEEYAARVK